MAVPWHYVIRLNQGDYYQERGGNDWGRADRYSATVYSDRRQVHRIARKLTSFGARVVRVVA